MVGKPPRTSLNDHERLRCLRRKKTRRFDCGGSAKSASGLCARLWPSFTRSFRALGVRQLLLPTFSHRGITQVCDLPRERYSRDSCRNPSFSQAEGLHDRTAKSAEEVAATARAPGAGVRNSAVFRARSASDGDDTRGFSPCLTFWYFWVKPKVQRKNVADFGLLCKGWATVLRISPASFLALSFEERAKEDREAKMIGNPPRTSLNDHKRLRCFSRSFRALGVRRLLRPTFSHRGDRQAYGLPRNTMQSARSSGALAPRGPKPPPAFLDQILFLLFLSKKAPKKTARRK